MIFQEKVKNKNIQISRSEFHLHNTTQLVSYSQMQYTICEWKWERTLHLAKRIFFGFFETIDQNAVERMIISLVDVSLLKEIGVKLSKRQ